MTRTQEEGLQPFYLPMLTPDQIAKRLSVSRSMVYALIRTGKLRAIMVGRLPRISEAAFAEFLGAS